MELQLIRNATMKFKYGGHLFLTDPYFAPRHSRPSFAGKSPNPLVDLPTSPEHIMAGIEMVVISHLHSDHFDPVAQEMLSKLLPIFCQPGDEAEIREKGFHNVTPIERDWEWQGIRISRTGGHHGIGEVEGDMGVVSGFVFSAPGELTVYWAGDTVLCDEVRSAISAFKPDVIVTHSSGATWPISTGEQALIVMDSAQTIEVCSLAPEGVVVAVHLDSLDHGTVTRADLHARVAQRRPLIPQDGETLTFNM